MSEGKALELVVQELQDRIGRITSSYETQMAVLKAQATLELQDAAQKIEELGKEVESLKAKPEPAKKS